jgi:hypothetical protein
MDIDMHVIIINYDRSLPFGDVIGIQIRELQGRRRENVEQLGQVISHATV